jgi:nitrile hydratase
MGGMQDMGPVRREPNGPLFHASWERRMFALFNALDLPWPVMRQQIDLIPPADYLRISYYERWLSAIVPLMTNAGMLSPSEIETGQVIGGKNDKWHVTTVAEVASWGLPDPNPETFPHAVAAFRVGQHVRARNLNPTGHTRLPRYARGKAGTIGRDHGVASFDDAVAQGVGKKPQHLYTVRFAARELWGETASPRGGVYLALWEDYLEAA